MQYDASGAMVWADGAEAHAYAVVAGGQVWNWTANAWEAMPAAVTPAYLRAMPATSLAPAAWSSDTTPEILPHPMPISAIIFNVDADGAVVGFAGSAFLQAAPRLGSVTISADG